MTNKNNNSNINPESCCSNSKQQNNFSSGPSASNICTSSKYKNVEPLPESSRPRRDGPGGEDAK